MSKIQHKQLDIRRLDNVTVRAQGNLTLSGEQTIDGVLTSASRVLVDQQTTPTEDGIYLTGSGAWTREKDLDVGDGASGRSVWVEEGTVDGAKLFNCTNVSGSDVIGTDGLTFAEITGTGEANETHAQELVASELVVNSDTALADTLDNTPTSDAAVKLFLNGVLLRQGATFDYTISGTTITWLASSGTAPNLNTNDEILAVYQY